MATVFWVALPKGVTQGFRLSGAPAGGLQGLCMRSREWGEGTVQPQPPSPDTGHSPSRSAGPKWSNGHMEIQGGGKWNPGSKRARTSGGLLAASTAGDGTPGSPESRKGRQLLREHLQKKRPGRSVSWIAQTEGQHAKETETSLLAAWHHWWCLLRVCFDQIFISTQRTLSSLLLLHGKATMVWRPSTVQLCCWSAWKLCLQASVTLLRKWG